MTQISTEQLVTPEIVNAIVHGIQEVKGKQIAVLDLTEINGRCCDYFVICQGDSTTQVGAIAKSVEEQTEEASLGSPWHVEGRANAEWVLLDYGNVVVHVFLKNKREHYDIEGLWADAKRTVIEDTY